MTVLEIVSDVAGRLEELKIRYVIGGSLASSVWGEWRNTNDADIAIQISQADVPNLMKTFGEPYYVHEPDLTEAIASTQAFRSAQLLHMEEVFKIDLFLLPESEYSTTVLARAVEVEVLEGIRLRYSSAEDMIVTKLRWFQLGGQVSDRQWNDIVKMLDIQLPKLDRLYLVKWCEAFGVIELLKEAVSQARSV